MARRRKTSGKRRRSVRCTLCTPHRWMGNAKGRFKAKDEREMRDRKRLDAELKRITPPNAELLKLADRFPAPQEWYDE